MTPGDAEMITHTLQPDGTWKKLSREEQYEINERELGLSRMKQDFIRKFDEIPGFAGDCIDLSTHHPNGYPRETYNADGTPRVESD